MNLKEFLDNWVENPNSGLVDYYGSVEQYLDDVYNDEAEEKIKILASAMGDDAINNYAHDYLDELYNEYNDDDDEDENPYADTYFTCDTFVNDFFKDILDYSDMKDNLKNLADSEYCTYSYDDIFFMFGLESEVIGLMREEIEDIEDELHSIDDSDIVEEQKKRIDDLKKKMQQIRKDKYKFDSNFVAKRKSIRGNKRSKKLISYSDVENAAEEFAENNDYNGLFIERGYITSKGALMSNDSIKRFMGTLDNKKSAVDIRHGDADSDFVKYLCQKLDCTEDDLFDAIGLSVHDAMGSADSLVGDKLNWIRVNAGFERYIALPMNKITVTQQQALIDWIDEFFQSNIYLHVTTSNGMQVKYSQSNSFDDELVDGEYIIKRIMQFYRMGTLLERKNKISCINLNENTQSVFSKIKSGISIDDSLYYSLKPFLTDFLRSVKDHGNQYEVIKSDGFLSTMQKYGFTAIKDKNSTSIMFLKTLTVQNVGKVNINISSVLQEIQPDSELYEKSFKSKNIMSIDGLNDAVDKSVLSLTLSNSN